MGFTTSYGSLGTRLDTLIGTNPAGDGVISRLVDLTVGTDADGHSILRAQPPIFYVDGYWRADGTTFNHAKVEPAVNNSTYSWELRDLSPIEPEVMSPPVTSLVYQSDPVGAVRRVGPSVCLFQPALLLRPENPLDLQ